jgi:hypothetical protein
MKTTGAVLFACLTALALSAQETGKMEGDAKRATPDASGSGRKYAKAAAARTRRPTASRAFLQAPGPTSSGQLKAARET